MGISCPAIKKNARLTISGTKPSPVLIGLVYLLIVFLLRFLSFAVSGGLKEYAYMAKQFDPNVNYDYASILKIAEDSSTAAGTNLGTWGQVLMIALFLMTVMMGIGFTIYCLKVCEFQKAGTGTLFDGFAIFMKALWLYILMAILVFLWSLLLVIPGIIALYRYRMAIYVMIENPHMNAIECLVESRRMMTGHKLELFVLDLSFVGWFLLIVVFPPVLVWVAPYYSVTAADFYIALRDIPKPDPYAQ